MWQSYNISALKCGIDVPVIDSLSFSYTEVGEETKYYF